MPPGRWCDVEKGGRADQPAESLDSIPAFQPHSSFLAREFTVSARPVYSTAGLVEKSSEPAIKQSGQSIYPAAKLDPKMVAM